MAADITFCRFCAQFKPIAKLYNLQSNVTLYEDIKLKVEFIQINFVNLCTESNYPLAVCFVCKESLDQAYIFYKKVEKAQDVVRDLLTDPESFRIASEQSTSYCIKTESSAEDFPEEVISENESIISLHTKQEDDDKNDTVSEASSSQTQYPEIPIEFEETEIKINKKEIDEIEKPKSWNHIRWICDHCSNEFKDIESLRIHAMSDHNICRAFRCPECSTYHGPKSFNGFIRHVCKHYTNLRKCCIHCNLICETSKAALAHSTDHIRDKAWCGICGDIFDSEDNLQKHRNLFAKTRERKSKNREGVFGRTCKICKKIFESASFLPKHMSAHHRTETIKRSYECHYCGVIFKHKANIIRHIKAHQKIFKCKLCNKSFKSRVLYMNHVERHLGVKKYQCDECGKKTRTKREIEVHILIHNDSKAFSCDICEKQFRLKHALQKHMLQHTGQKPYVCDVCNKTFTDHSNKNKHMKRIHNIDAARKFKVIKKPTEKMIKMLYTT